MERPEKQQEGPPPPILPLSGEATDWLASLEILCQFCQDFIDKRLSSPCSLPRHTTRYP